MLWWQCLILWLFCKNMFIKGVLLGISLSFMVGPLLFAIISAAIEKGFRAGIALAAGIWTGDFFYILAVRYGAGALEALTALPNFRFWAGLCGGAVLLVFGLGAFLSKVYDVRDAEDTQGDRLLDRLDGPEKPGVKHNWQRLGLPGYWLRGFLINLINPFTLFFWLGITSAIIIPNQWGNGETLLFFSGMMGTLIATDILKAYAAKRVKRWLTPAHIRLVQKGIGILLMVFGLVVAFQSLAGGRQ